MASDGTTGQIPVASPVQGSQAASFSIQSGGGKSLSQTGKFATSAGSQGTSAAAVSDAGAASAGIAASIATASAVAGAASTSNESAQHATDPQALVSQLNKYLNNSGRPDQFRLDPASGGKLIQKVNPATGAVVGEFSAEEFPALARSVGATSIFIDSRA